VLEFRKAGTTSQREIQRESGDGKQEGPLWKAIERECRGSSLGDVEEFSGGLGDMPQGVGGKQGTRGRSLRKWLITGWLRTCCDTTPWQALCSHKHWLSDE